MEEEKKNTEETLRNPEEEYLDLSPTDDFNSPQYQIFLSSVFNFGTIPPKTFELGTNFKVKLRILTPIENLEILKKVDLAPGPLSKTEILVVESLTRALETVNGHVLRFDDEMIKEWQQFRNTSEKPTGWEQQRYILQYRFQKPVLMEIYSKYQELLREQEQVLENLKKRS